MIVSLLVTPFGVCCVIERVDGDVELSSDDVERAARAFCESLYGGVTVPITSLN
jgi:hypothetical protein